MNNYTTDKEIRNLIFFAIAIFLALVVCITNIASGNMLGTVISIGLLALLSGILGYIYCKYEENVFKGADKEKAKDKAKSSGVSKNVFGGITVARENKEAVEIEKHSEKPEDTRKPVEKVW